MNIINNMSTKIRSGKCLGDACGLFGIKPSACPHVGPHSAPYCVCQAPQSSCADTAVPGEREMDFSGVSAAVIYGPSVGGVCQGLGQRG